jgi:hypothetical protein
MTIDSLVLVKVRDGHLRMGFLLERQQLAVDELLNLKLKGPTIFDVMPE